MVAILQMTRECCTAKSSIGLDVDVWNWSYYYEQGSVLHGRARRFLLPDGPGQVKPLLGQLKVT